MSWIKSILGYEQGIVDDFSDVVRSKKAARKSEKVLKEDLDAASDALDTLAKTPFGEKIVNAITEFVSERKKPKS